MQTMPATECYEVLPADTKEEEEQLTTKPLDLLVRLCLCLFLCSCCFFVATDHFAVFRRYICNSATWKLKSREKVRTGEPTKFSIIVASRLWHSNQVSTCIHVNERIAVDVAGFTAVLARFNAIVH